MGQHASRAGCGGSTLQRCAISPGEQRPTATSRSLLSDLAPCCALYPLDPSPRTPQTLPAALQSRLQGSTEHRAGRTTAWPLSRFGSAHQPFFRPACAKRCPARAERSQLRTAAFTPAPRLWSLGKIENLYYYRYDSTVYYYSRLMDCYWENIYEHRAPPQKLEKTRQSMKKKIF